MHKSAITDHAIQQNHVIAWDSVKIVDKESERKIRWIKESIAIRREESRCSTETRGSIPYPAYMTLFSSHNFLR